MSDEPDWAKVLHALHDGQLSTDMESGGPFRLYELQEYLGENTELTEEEVRESINYLDDVGLVYGFEDLDGEEIHGGLTPKGFEVAHERELTKRQDRTTTTLVVFTLALVLATLVEVLPPELQVLRYDFNLRLVGAIVLLEVLVWYILYTGLHEDLLDL